MKTSTRSHWNRFLEHRLEVGAQLTADGHRLADALMRSVLGWNKTEERLGRELLRELTGMHGRSLDRAVDNLVDVGLIDVEKEGRGRGKRTLFRLVLDATEKAAVERHFPAEEKAARKCRAGAATKGKEGEPATTGSPKYLEDDVSEKGENLGVVETASVPPTSSTASLDKFLGLVESDSPRPTTDPSTTSTEERCDFCGDPEVVRHLHRYLPACKTCAVRFAPSP